MCWRHRLYARLLVKGFATERRSNPALVSLNSRWIERVAYKTVL